MLSDKPAKRIESATTEISLRSSPDASVPSSLLSFSFPAPPPIAELKVMHCQSHSLGDLLSFSPVDLFHELVIMRNGMRIYIYIFFLLFFNLLSTNIHEIHWLFNLNNLYIVSRHSGRTKCVIFLRKKKFAFQFKRKNILLIKVNSEN